MPKLSAPVRSFFYLALLGALLITIAMVVLYVQLPTSFLPDEDQGMLMAMVQLPEGATDARTQAATQQLVEYMLAQPEVVATGRRTGRAEVISSDGQAMV